MTADGSGTGEKRREPWGTKLRSLRREREGATQTRSSVRIQESGIAAAEGAGSRR